MQASSLELVLLVVMGVGLAIAASEPRAAAMFCLVASLMAAGCACLPRVDVPRCARGSAAAGRAVLSPTLKQKASDADEVNKKDAIPAEKNVNKKGSDLLIKERLSLKYYRSPKKYTDQKTIQMLMSFIRESLL